ncbi:hypothetical protein L7F22_004333 [Adiantum nelumboides]|nr:hypothetical protein [Adiantum nelumboides]
MNEMNMPLTYWAEAVHTAVHIMNRTPTAAIHEISPYERLYGIKPTVSYMKVFGCVCYVHVPNEARKKMEPKAVKCIFLGYPFEKKGYKCYDPGTRQVYVSRDVRFCEYEPWYKPKPMTIEDEYEEQDNVRHVVDESGPSTITISGPHMTEESTGSVNPWSGRLRDKKQDKRGKKKMFEESSGDESFDEEHGLPHLRTPGSIKAALDVSGCDLRQLRLERREDGHIRLLFLRHEGHRQTAIERYTHGRLHEQRPGSLVFIDYVKPYILVEKLVQWSYDGPFRLPWNTYYHQGIVAFLYCKRDDIDPRLWLLDGAQETQVAMPQLMVVDGLILETTYRIAQMDEQLLLVVIKQEPTFITRKVLVFKFDFPAKIWLCIFNNLRVPFPLPQPSPVPIIGAIARANFLFLLLSESGYVCDLSSNTWRFPPYYYPAPGASFDIVDACAQSILE